MQPPIYLDYQGSTPLDPRVKVALFEAYDAVGNPSSEEHAFGWGQAQRVSRARENVAALAHTSSGEVVFTSGATEANNIAIIGAAFAAPKGRRRVIISAIEHKSVIEAANSTRRFGFEVEMLRVGDDGVVNPNELSRKMGSDVAVVSIMGVNNEIGTMQLTPELGSIAQAHGAFFHVDATQAAAAMEIDLGGWNADAISLSSHKIYGPNGIGALVLSEDAPWRPHPITFGGGQEMGLRPGTLPTSLCVGFGEACRLLLAEGATERPRIRSLRQRLLRRLLQAAPTAIETCRIAERHPGCLHVRFPGISAADLLMRLQPRVAASTGSACTSGMIGPSEVLLALGLNRTEASECLRFSLGRFTTEADIDAAAEAISAVLARIACATG
jgi:cysteine desulfurase